LPFVPEELHDQPSVAVIVCWSGDVDDGRQVVRPWLELGPPPIQFVDAIPYTAMQTLLDDLQPPGRRTYWKSGYLYVNFLSEEGHERVRAAYGADMFARLTKIKAAYDPTNLFALNRTSHPLDDPCAMRLSVMGW
jgi:hypothetical protein